jgi:hypothetical protein
MQAGEPLSRTLHPNRVIYKAREGDAFRFADDPSFALALCERVEHRAHTAGADALTLVPRNLFSRHGDALEARDRINCLMALAEENDPTYQSRSLQRYVGIDTNDPPLVRDLLQAERREETELVYIEGATGVTSEPVTFNFDNWSAIHLDYLGLEGIDIRGLWSRMVHPLLSVRFAEVEIDWSLTHQFLGGLIDGACHDNMFGFADHGTAILSVILSVLGKPFANAPESTPWGPATEGHVVSSVAPMVNSPFMPNPVNEAAIVEAAGTLQAGDVLLLEIEKTPNGFPKPLPIEAEQATWDVIRAVTANQVIVIEPAGNGGVLLDNIVLDNGVFSTKQLLPDGSLHPFVDPARDSKAIMVGAGDALNRYAPLGSSNLGQRVDCFAAGTGVVSTCTLQGNDPLPYATNGIKQTSVAGAIMAGATMQLQAYLRARGVAPLTPDHFIALLRDDSLSTKTTSEIGNMPSFGRIAQHVIQEAFH